MFVCYKNVKDNKRVIKCSFIIQKYSLIHLLI